MDLNSLKWDDKGLISVIFQDHQTGEVLTLGYMNREALQRTLETGKVHLFRRSRGRVMMKGETSGNVQLVKEIWVDCDADALVIKIEQIGGAACHEGYRSCFYRKLVDGELQVIGERVFDPKEVYPSGPRGGPSGSQEGRPVTERRPCVAIDGPVGAGKSTIARLVARELGYTYVDSGAMYRALAWAALERGIQADDRAQACPELRRRAVQLLRDTAIELNPRPDGMNEVFVNGRDVTSEIRTPEVSQLASRLSAMTPVRRRMVALQRQMAKNGGVVMEGRDIQTVVLPDAEVKIFLTGSAEERAERRWLELRDRGVAADRDGVLADIKARDHRDSTRADSPLKPAPDATHVDTTGLTIEQVVQRVLAVVRQIPLAGTPDQGTAVPKP